MNVNKSSKFRKRKREKIFLFLNYSIVSIPDIGIFMYVWAYYNQKTKSEHLVCGQKLQDKEKVFYFYYLDKILQFINDTQKQLRQFYYAIQLKL